MIGFIFLIFTSMVLAEPEARLFDPNLNPKESEWIEAYQKWKSSLLTHQEQASKTCLALNSKTKFTDQTLNGPVTLQLVADRAQCQVKRAFFEAGFDPYSSEKLCEAINKNAQKIVKRTIASHRHCLQHYTSLINKDAERFIEMIRHHVKLYGRYQ